MCLLGIGLAAGIAWATFPAWAPVMLGHKLPADWRLVEMQTARPGLSSVVIDRLTLAGDLPGAALTARAADLTLGWRGPRIQLGRLALEFDLADGSDPATEKPGSPGESRWSLPRIIPPGGLPKIEIGQLDWSVTGLSVPQSGRIDSLVFGQDAAALQLATTLNPVPLLRSPGTLRMRLAEGAVELSIETQADPPERLVYYRQAQAARQPGAAEPGALASLSLTLDLGLLDLAETGRWLQQLGMDPPDRASGRVGIGLQFEGDEVLYPVAAGARLDQVVIGAGEETLAIDWAVNAGVQGERLVIEQESLAVTGTLVAGRLPGQFEQWMNAAGVTVPLTAGPFDVRLMAEGGWEARAGIDAPGEIDARGSGSIEVQQDGSELRLHLNDGRLQRRPSQPPALAGAVSLQARLDQGLTLSTDAGHLRMDSLDAHLSGSLVFGADGFRIERGRVEALGGSQLKLNTADYAADASTIQLRGELELGERSRFTGQVDGTALRVATVGQQASQPLFQASTWSGQIETTLAPATALTGQLRFEGVALPAMELRMDALDVDAGQLEIPALSGRLQLATTGLVLHSSGKPSSGVDAELAMVLAEGSVREGSGEILLGLTGALPVRFHAHPASGDLVVTLERAVLGATELPALARALEIDLPKQLVMRQGQLEFDGDITLAERDGSLAPSGELTVAARGVTLLLGETMAESLELTSRVRVAETVSASGAISANRITLAAGLEMSNLSTAIELHDPEHLALSDLRVNLLDGTVDSAGFSLAAGVIGDTMLNWRNFDLGRLLAFLDIDGLDGTGRVDATLPLVSAPDGLEIAAGAFRALGPGRIRYRTAVPAANVGMQALENFEYEMLEGGIDYQADGRYAISIRLLGRNPDLYGGHPIRFQLNLSGDLPALFYSLFVTGDFERAILEQVSSKSSEWPESQQR